ncbi:HPr family phosphocarrier protein [Vibrio astriarenae]|jgi:phosphocarrier protein NPr|uniref:HPr family phosphocarrier protein n=1 Tax=Vibrio agarivorans TaxID=153622 RepID=A0ABT7Y2C9_9VIBR|nr:HPr family phosphocarrier protein [Vibrio agarivorans]MDN2482160.1 HPr family phosphocarrier protein [Vibrio agarivorans]MDN3661702.1 HPr family phosphocarrier protein [Vibrio agarivorans]
MAHTQTVRIENRLGLHARAAVKLVELAQSFSATITIRNPEGKEAIADSVMGLLMLESAQGQDVTIMAEGSQSEEALKAICHLIQDKFDEED